MRAQRERFAVVLSARTGRHIRGETLRRWERRYRLGGAAALVDQRGRNRGGKPLDAELLLAFSELRGAGMTVGAAHRRMVDRAAREHRAWCSISTLRRLKRGTTPYAVRKSKPDNDNFLQRGTSVN